MRQLKDAILVQIPVHIDWTKFKNTSVKTDDEKIEFLKKISKSLTNNSIKSEDENDSQPVGIITNVEIVNPNQLSLFGMMFAATDIKTKTIFNQDGTTSDDADGLSIIFDKELNKKFQRNIKFVKTAIDNLSKEYENIN